MLRVGLSGGIGSGKSTVAARLAELGAVVVDADRVAREVVEPGRAALEAVRQRFGDGVVGADGALDRAALGAFVFADPAALRDLEAITHPAIRERTAELVDEAVRADPAAVVVHDMPLLVEKRMSAGYHLVVVVDTAVETRVRRLVGARGLTEADARSRIRAQASDADRYAAADVLLDNNGAPAAARAEVDRLWADRLVPFEENVRHGVAARPPEPLTLVAPRPASAPGTPSRPSDGTGWPCDEVWAAQAARLLDRATLAIGDVAVTADHVGGTSVPDVPATDVVDLQVGVTSLADADRDDVVRRLAEAGFPRLAWDWTDESRAGRGSPRVPGPPWPKRLHASADPGRLARIHLREAGSPAWRWALLLRDWLRSDAGARREYTDHERALAARGLTSAEHAAAQEPWSAATAERAEAWAEATGWRRLP